ncbi:aminotransferase class V-fold PLP-dependent enzyme [Acetobacteraceae bacterium]|nr:aminotransferase class V-fold PLP-dependent enzyme [Acetobacteraceae bacterium]
MIYLDANASEVPRPHAVELAYKLALGAGNPASVHQAGKEAKRHLEKAREEIASFFAVGSKECIFTSGASEANALILKSLEKTQSGVERPCFVGATEHPSLLANLPEWAKIIPVDQSGQHDLQWLEGELSALKPEQSPLIAVMVANNETGIYSDVTAFIALAKLFNAFLHLDGVQAFGRGWALPKDLPPKISFSLSGHKMGGLPGAGALIVSEEHVISPMIIGGGQEGGKRGGTPALPAIAAMAEALKEAQTQNWQDIEGLRNELEEAVQAMGGEVIGKDVARLPNVSSLRLNGISSQAQLMAMDMSGICVSAGSACASGKMSASSVLKAMGLAERAGQVMRVSLPWNVTQREIEFFLNAYRPLARRAKTKLQAEGR